jgi:hypothetical protein
MTSEEKQQYLREHIIEGGYNTEDFISFLESKKVEGSNIDNWDFDLLQEVVAEFKNLLSEGETIERRVTTKGQALAMFGGSAEDDEDDKSSSSSSNDSDEYKVKKNKDGKKDDKKEDSSSSSSEEEKKELKTMPVQTKLVTQSNFHQ